MAVKMKKESSCSFVEKDLKLLKLEYEFKFGFPQSKILSMSGRRLKVACRVQIW